MTPPETQIKKVNQIDPSIPMYHVLNWPDKSGFIFVQHLRSFRPVVPFGYLLFIHALTNATDDHKYSPLPSADFDSSEVLVSFSAFIFS